MQSSLTQVGPVKIALLTGGGDRHYALGLLMQLAAQGAVVDFIGSDDLDDPKLHGTSQIRFLNLRRNMRTNVPVWKKIIRVLAYYLRLFIYAATAEPKIFHILWNNKFEFFDRTVLMAYYRLCGKRLFLTAHNVNAGKRDGNDSWLNRVSLRMQYRFADGIFVHTQKMKAELISEFGVPDAKAIVIPYGINDQVPDTALSPSAARQRLGLGPRDRVLLCFGGITPYKGLEYAVHALAELVKSQPLISQPPSGLCRLIIAGKLKGNTAYWQFILAEIDRLGLRPHVLVRTEFIPDAETEVYFKAADVLVLPYTHIFQSGVMFLGYSFGLPVIVSDVGSLKEDVVPGKTGFVFEPKDSVGLAKTIEEYFASDLYKNLESARGDIKSFASERHSWHEVAEITVAAYTRLLVSLGDATCVSKGT